MDLNLYNAISGKSEVIGFTYPIPFVFTVSENDYLAGHVRRFFVQKINDNIVIETSLSNYTDISNKLYLKQVIKWNLVGPERNVYKNGKLYECGIYESNKHSINEASKYMPGLSSYITNFTQHMRNIKS